MTRPSVKTLLDEATGSLRDATPGAARARLETLAVLSDRSFRAPHLLRRYHDLLCFLRAYPDDRQVLLAAQAELDRLGERIRSAGEDVAEALLDSGIDGTPVVFEFTYEAAVKLVGAFPGELEIDWDAWEEPEKLDELLVHLITHAEIQTFDEGEIATAEWVRMAKGAFPGTDAEWLIREVERTDLPHLVRKQLYDAAGVPVRWDLSGSAGSVTRCRIDSAPIAYRAETPRPVMTSAAAEIVRPVRRLRCVPSRDGLRLVQQAVAAIGARHREVYAFNYGNPGEVWLADLSRGVRVLVIGVEPERRFNLEGNYGFVAFKNGVPVSYGGASPLFHQANTGVNVFPAYRAGGEAQFIFTQVLRTFRSLFGNTRFVVNPFQFGGDNPEAIASGAFWFYHKLGFVPVDEEIRALADSELAKRRRRKGHRSDPRTLRRLAAGDLLLSLRGDRSEHAFPEAWLGRLAQGVTERLGASPSSRGRLTRARRITREIARRLGVRGWAGWTRAERTAFHRLAPVVSLVDDLDDWTAEEKRRLVGVIRAKAGERERDYARALRDHGRFRRSLAAWCVRHQAARDEGA